MKKAGILMIIGSALLLSLFYYPLWNIHLIAPQYPEGIGMNIHINDIKGVEEFDVDKVDMLNHYIGMKPIPKPHEMIEFTLFPIVISIMAGLGMLIGVIGFFGKLKPKWFMGWLVLMVGLGIVGMWDFNQWMVDYGTNLDPNAAIILMDEFENPMEYNPPLIGHKKLLNFDVDSWPQTGGYLMGLGLLFVFLSYFVGKKEYKKKEA